MTVFPVDLINKADALLQFFRDRNERVCTAESCTGGLIVGCLTEIAGSSDVVDRGFVTYSNGAKMKMLGVDEELLIAHGAVSQPVAKAMAAGALARADAHIAVAVTGVAGPGGGTDEKPVGLVHFAVASKVRGEIETYRVFEGSRSDVRVATVSFALDLLRDLKP